MKKVLDITAGFAQEFAMIFGEDKSQVMAFDNTEDEKDTVDVKAG